MRKKFFAPLSIVQLVIVLFLTSFITNPVFAQFAGGSGTEDDPWQIETAEHLDDIRNYSGYDYEDKFFEQVDDIDLTAFLWNEDQVDYINDGHGWLPLGESWDEPFMGTYLGNGHTISGLVINRSGEDYQGLFGVAYFADLSNLGLEEVSIEGGDFTGGLVGNNFDSNISDCHVTGDIVTDGNQTGGLVGSTGMSEIRNSYSEVNVTGNAWVGGLIGFVSDESIIENCHSIGEVTAKERTAGGLIGGNHDSNLHNNYSESKVNGNAFHTGGLVGLNDNSTISYSHSSGDVAGWNHTGGLAGTNRNGSKIIDSYSSSKVTGENHTTGGLVGKNFDKIQNRYSSGTVTGESTWTGGLVGLNRPGAVILKCYSTADVSGDQKVGGLVGYSVEADLNKSYSTGTVSGNGVFAGGLVGNTLGGTIQNSYSKSDVSGQDWVAGLVGMNSSGPDPEEGQYDLTIINSYSSGSVTVEEEHAGGLVAGHVSRTEVHSESSYWNKQTSGQYSSVVGRGRYTEEMSYPYEEDTYVDWDFDDIWLHDSDNSVNNGYPYILIDIIHTNIYDPETDAEIPQKISLSQNYPNPFNPDTRITYKIPSTTSVTLKVYTILGRHVSTLVNETQPAGGYEITFDGSGLSSGTYIYRLRAGEFVDSKCMMLVK